MNLEDEVITLAKNIFSTEDPYDPETINAYKQRINKTWLTRQYFSLGRNSLVLPAWLIEQLGPYGTSQNGFATLPGIGNTDHRNYIMLGGANSNHEPVIDHKGGIIPRSGSYTLIFGALINGKAIFSPERGQVKIDLHKEGYPIAEVKWEVDGDTLIYECCASRDEEGNESLGVILLKGLAKFPLLLALTPFDQDGLTEVSKINWKHRKGILSPAEHPPILIEGNPIKTLTLPAKEGHAGKHIASQKESMEDACEAKASSWAASFPVRSTPTLVITLEGEVVEEPDSEDVALEWKEALKGLPKVSTSNPKADELFKNSIITLRLLSDLDYNELTVGPSGQEKTWLPAFVFQARALDRVGFGKKYVRPVIDNLISKVTEEGFPDKNNQWDVQGSLVMAIINHYYQYPDINWLGDRFNAIRKIVDYMLKMQEKTEKNGEVEVAGLLPPGNPPFFDPIYWRRDIYFVHSLWSLYGLQTAKKIADLSGRKSETEKLDAKATRLRQILIDRLVNTGIDLPYVPSGPYQQENSTIFFNLYGFYPLQLVQPNFQPLTKTLDHILENYMFDGGFMVYQPWNAYGSYFSMQIAQMLRYVGKYDKILPIIDYLVSKRTTMQGWAEGISPFLGTGSVGDCPNGFASAEWINLILDLFAEERFGEDLTILKGMPEEWLKKGVAIKDLLLEENAKLNVKAKLIGKKLKVTYKYTGSKDIHIDIPHTVDKAKGAIFVKTNLYKMKTKSGTATFDFK